MTPLLFQAPPRGECLQPVRLVRQGVFGKTSTANMDNASADPPQGAKGSPAAANQVVWFICYVAAHTLPDQPHTLAFAVSISHSSLTGGAHAARVLAALLGAIQEQVLKSNKA